MATNARLKGKNAPPGAFPASSYPTKSAGGRSSSSRPAQSSASSLPSSSSNTPANLSDVEHNTSNRNHNLNGATLSSAFHVVSDSEDDGGGHYGRQQQQASSKGKQQPGGGTGNTNNIGHKHRRPKSIVRSSGPADELGLLVEELQQAAGGCKTKYGKGKARADTHPPQPRQQ